jgi:hypothetical protein
MIMAPLLLVAAGAGLSASPAAALACETPDEIQAGQPLVLRCAAPPRREVVVLVHFRQAGHEAFTTATAHPSEGWYTASLRGDALGAGPVHYYVEARDPRGRVVATSGDAASPHIVSVIGQRARARPRATGDSDDPLAHLRVEREAARTSAEVVGRRRPGHPFLGMGIGWGYGWHPAGGLDLRRDLAASAGGGSAGAWS